LAYLKLQWLGFRFYRLSFASFFMLFPFRPVGLTTHYRSPSKRLSYWYRPHSSTTRLPILFIHGIGIGLYPYTGFLSDVDRPVHDHASGDRGSVGILAIEIMPISFRITHNALDKDEMCVELRRILAAHNYDRVVLVSHSYGSIVSSFIMADQVLRPKVASALLVDPVSFLLHIPDVAYNFTVRQPRHANEWQLWYFASKDPGVAHALGRRFFWSQNVIWKKDVEDFVNEGRRLTVSLGGKDLIVNTEAIGRHLANSSTNREGGSGVGPGHENKDYEFLCSSEDAWKQRKWEGNGLDVLWFDPLDHGQAFDRNGMRASLVKVVQNYCGSG
jgi:pimeloyl-ACP methyl ester carboxylesterase